MSKTAREAVSEFLLAFQSDRDTTEHPVRLPSGRARLETRPSLTGSSPTLNTMGIVAVAALAANATGLPPVAAMTATCRRTNSAASAGSRSYCPSAQRCSIARFWPSIKPASLKPWRNAATRWAYGSGVAL